MTATVRVLEQNSVEFTKALLTADTENIVVFSVPPSVLSASAVVSFCYGKLKGTPF